MGRKPGLANLLLWMAAQAFAQGGPVIEHEADECWLKEHFPQLQAGIDPGDEVQTAKVYFRSDKYPDFYYVEMAAQDVASFLAVLPIPGPDTERVIYYLEAIDRSFGSARSEEFQSNVDDPCRRRPAGFYTGQNPGIVVGATKAGMTALPPGFQAAGIAGFISAAGVSSGVGGGVGLGTAAVIAGVGAAGATGVVVATSGGEASTSAPGSAPPTTTIVAGSSSTTTAPPSTTTSARASSSTTSAPASTTSVTPTSTTTMPTTTVPTTSTTTSPTTSTTTVPVTTSSTSSTTSSIPTTTTTVPVPPVSACFSATKQNSCVWRFDASCSTGPIIQYVWLIDALGNMPAPRPPINHSGQVVVVDWNPPPYGGCSGSPLISVQLTVIGTLGQTDVKSQNHNIDLKSSESTEMRASVTSYLGVPPFDGTSHGFVVLNHGRTDTTESSAPYVHLFRGVSGRNTLEGFTDVNDAGESYWKFDFSATANFVPGSLRVERGAVVLIDARSIVFRLAGTTERVELSFELSR